MMPPQGYHRSVHGCVPPNKWFRQFEVRLCCRPSAIATGDNATTVLRSCSSIGSTVAAMSEGAAPAALPRHGRTGRLGDRQPTRMNCR